MNIKEIIVSESKLRSTTEGLGDDVVDFGKEVGTGVTNIGTGLYNTGVDAAKGVANTATKVYNDPKQAVKNVVDPIKAGAKYAYNNPEQIAKDAGEAYLDGARSYVNFMTGQGLDKALAYGSSKINGTDYDKEFDKQQQISRNAYARSPIAASIPQTVDDAVRKGANTLTFGYADKLDAKMNSMMNGNNYDDELAKTYNASADALDRSPIASKVGEIGSYLAPQSAFNVGMKGAYLLSKGLSKAVPTAVATSKAGKVAKAGTGVVGGVAADLAAAKSAKSSDPNNPHVVPVQEGPEKIIKPSSGTGKGYAAGNYAGSSMSLRNAAASKLPSTQTSATSTSIRTTATPKTSTPSTPVTPTTPTPSDIVKRVGNLEKKGAEKNPGFLSRTGTRIKDAAITGTIIGVPTAGAARYWLGPAPENYDSLLNPPKPPEPDDEGSSDKQSDASQSSPSDIDSTTNSTNSINTDNGNPFDALKTNEDLSELARIKYLSGYRK